MLLNTLLSHRNLPVFRQEPKASPGAHNRRRPLIRRTALALAILPWLVTISHNATAASKPNILVIVADDLGYSDLGVFGSENKTPNLDQLAKKGRLLQHFYSQPTCSPTRSELISGVDHHLNGVGSMRELLAPDQAGHAGYEGVLSNNVATLPSLLRDAGYNTYMAGKWHLGGAPGQRPGSRGFDKSFALMPGGASHFKQAVQRLGGPPTAEPVYTENDQIITLPDDFYSSKTYTDKAIEYIDSGLGNGKPFFAYVTYTAPHWPIQAPDANLAKVRGRYNAGYEELARQRFTRQQSLGLVAQGVTQPPLPAGVAAWNDLSADEKARSIRTYEAYAAAVESLDDNVGRLIQHLSDKGELDNTFIFFTSDNGAEGNDISKFGISNEPTTGQQYQTNFYNWLATDFDNSLDNIGRKNSYVFIKEGWGQASALPNRLYKGTTTEGGINVPAFVYYPRTIKPGKSKAVATVRDLLPTLLEVAGTRHPGISYKGNPVLPVQGTSFLSQVTGNENLVHNATVPFGFELFGHSALRKGPWKIVRIYPPQGDGTWQLFNLAQDPGELVNLASDQPQKLAELQRDWRAYVDQNNVIELGYNYGYGWIDDTLLRVH